MEPLRPDSVRPASVPHKKRYTADSLRARREWVAEATGAELGALSGEEAPSATLFSGNIESHVGFVQVPIGVAGPLLINGEHAQGVFYVPLATTEGALVASCTRGMRAVSESGGATVRVVSDQMMRSPMFTFDSLVTAVAFAAWVRASVMEIRAVAEAQSRVARLLSLEPMVLGDTVCVQLSFHTGDAYGANMVMKCCWAVCQWIAQEFPAQTGLTPSAWYVDSQLGGEKKVNAMAYTSSLRGKRVVAETHLRADVMRRILRVSPEDLFSALNAGMGPTLAAHMLGCNVNFANVVAALYTATGQDIATVPESSQGQISFRLTDEGMYFGVMLPNVVVATVGGGTALPSQRASLDMLDCFGEGKARRLAEIVACAAMSLDLSTYAAIAADHFVQAHERLGRNRPAEELRRVIPAMPQDRFAEPGTDPLVS
ncbi:MAG TPA: hydroxymethylglutaryl-CoA reductase [Pantanalinema sp.]